MDPKQQPDGSFSMTPSTRELLAQLDAEKCIGCCMQRSKILEEALTDCRIPGYVQPCAEDGWSPLLIATRLHSESGQPESEAVRDCSRRVTGYSHYQQEAMHLHTYTWYPRQLVMHLFCCEFCESSLAIVSNRTTGIPFAVIVLSPLL